MLGNAVNIVLIFCDDLGTFDMGFNGHPSIMTPNIDRMAMEGAIFTDWLSAAPICTPSRASLYTGRLPIRNGLYADMQYVPPGQNMSSFGLDAWQRKDGKGGLASSETTFADLVRKQHWDTKLVGKWHLGQSKYEFWPTSHGFSEFVGSLSTHDHGGMPGQYPCTVVANGTRVVYRLTNGGMPPQGGDDPTRGPHECNVSQVVNGGDGATPLGIDELMPLYTSECLKFIHAHSKTNPMATNAPFLLVFAPDNTHVPVYASKRFRGTSARGTYGDAVQELDWSVGQILSAIKTSGLDSTTMVILTSDNGAQGGAGNNGCQGMFKCMKGTTWEGGFREPAVIRFPSVVAPMQRITATVSTLDLFPTICELAQVQLPPTLQLDGQSLMPLLRRPRRTIPTSHEPPFRDSYFYWRGNAVFAQRSGPYKLHHYTQGCTNYWEPALQHHDPPLLFHIAHDPAEAFPLNASLPRYQPILATARAQLAAHLSAVRNDTTRSRVAQLNLCDSASALWPSSAHPPSKPYSCSYQFPREVSRSRGVTQRGDVVPFALDGCPGGVNSSLTRLLFRALNLSVSGLGKVGGGGRGWL